MGKHREQKTDLRSQALFEVKPNAIGVNFLVTTCHGLSGVEGLFSVKHIVFCMFKAGLCLWVFLG